ncbi:MAG TPA: hypothetical protein PK784_03900 [Tenuifilaceae bacterium]|nr:hypothetical protein [Tenuifilaceae bacterium]HOZ13908.1 hypothetical protein [Tenuifilaceae bacterium]HPN22977.1 hypothetical protein [Tenuifilaceae bacterium]
MSFSDWITVISILLALIIAIFKFDEWEIIRLKLKKRYIVLPLIFLILSGLSAFFHSNPHPNWLNFFWCSRGLQPGVWSIILIIAFFVCSFIKWKKITNTKPSNKLIKKYIDYLDNYEPSKFSSLFRKYETYFFESNDEKVWLPYSMLLTNEKWWLIASNYFKDLVFKHSSRFYDMNEDVLRSLLFSQLSNIPNSQITEELNLQNNGIVLSEQTPILNIFLSSPKDIETNRNKNIFIPLINIVADEYYNSIQFIDKDKSIFLLKPSDNSFKQVAPKFLIPFYFIQLVDCYWHQVIITKATVGGFFLYSTWTDKLLNVAPEINYYNESNNPTNLYQCAVNRMLFNIGNWFQFLKNNDSYESCPIAEHFTMLNHSVLIKIQKNIDKVPKAWFLDKVKDYLERIIGCKNMYNERFNFHYTNEINSSVLNNAFEKLTDEEFFLDLEKQNPGYQWLCKIIQDSESC